MGLRASRSASSQQGKSTSSQQEKKLKGKKVSMKGKRKDSDSDLDDEDCNLVTVPLGIAASDKRMSKAKELIASGRPISITLEATTEDTDENKKKNNTTWEDDAAREKWKEQLGLMRHFYDWEEIPLDFFIDTYVGGGGEAVRKRRLSLSLVTEPLANEPKPQSEQKEIRVIPKQNENTSPMPHQKPTPVSTVDVPRHRAASVAVPPSAMTSRPLPMQQFPTIREAPSPTNVSATGVAALPSTLPAVSAARHAPQLPERPAHRTRAASVAIGESFPLPAAAAIQKVSNPQAAPSAPKVNGPTDADLKRLSAAATPSKRVAGVIAQHQQSGDRASVRSDSQVASVKDQESRPRRASTTSIDQVYGRLGKPGGMYDRFEVENPIVHGSPTPQRRPTVSEKKPEQFKNMSPVIDPTQFANERRNTRVSIRKSIVDAPVFDYQDGRVSTASTKLESKSSGDPRSRTMSDWM